MQDWLADRYPVFKRNFGTSAGVLETLIKVCQTRGYKPVLFELPRDTAVIGSSLERADDQVPRQVQGAGDEVRRPVGEPRLRGQAAQLQLLRPLAPGGAGPQGRGRAC